MKNQRGVVYLEMLIGFLPVFMFFLGTLQVADLSVAHLVVEHAATTAARAAVVVLPDDGAYYKDEDNAAVDEFRDYRQSDVERAADTILLANPRLDQSNANVALDKDKYSEREMLSAQVSAPYHCLVPIFCPGGITISANAQLIYQGAHYIYEPSTGWASSAAKHGLGNLKQKVAEYREKKRQEREKQKQQPDDQDNAKHGDESKPDDEDTTKPDDDEAKDTDKPKDDDKAKDDDADEVDPATRKKLDELRKALPKKQQDIPIKIDPDLPGSTVQVHYTHDDKGRITGIEIHAGPDAKPRHIQDHVPTIKAMQRYQGVAGKVRVLAQRFTSWLTGHPNAGPGTLAWETKREVDKLNRILENRQRQLEDPNLTPAQRKQLENELDHYEKQLGQYEKTLDEITNEPGRGYVAAGSGDTAANLPPAVRNKLANDLTPAELDHVANQLSANLVSKLANGQNPMSASELKALADQVEAARKTNNIQGVDDWITFETSRDAPHARNAAAELTLAQRIAQEQPGSTVYVGGDQNAPTIPGTGGKAAPSFDLRVVDADGHERHIEVTSADGKVKNNQAIYEGVSHAISKLNKRDALGMPLPAQDKKDVAIAVDFYQGTERTTNPPGTREYSGDGSWTQTTDTGHVYSGSIISDFQKQLRNQAKDATGLDSVELMDASGNPIARFERNPDNTWSRVDE